MACSHRLHTPLVPSSLHTTQCYTSLSAPSLGLWLHTRRGRMPLFFISPRLMLQMLYFRQPLCRGRVSSPQPALPFIEQNLYPTSSRPRITGPTCPVSAHLQGRGFTLGGIQKTRGCLSASHVLTHRARALQEKRLPLIQ